MNDMITSVKNETIKNIVKLQKKKYRQQEQKFLLEGEHLIEEAIKSSWGIETVIVAEGFTTQLELADITIIEVASNVFEHMAQTKSPQGILAVVHMEQLEPKRVNRVVMLDAVQDPGNLGTIIRTADAAGFDLVILGEGTVDIYNDKVIRSTQGSLFHIAITHANLAESIAKHKEQGFVVCASTLEQAQPIQSLPQSEKMALIVGNEGNGVQPQHVELANKRIHIPIIGQAESLNVSVATGIMLYHMIL